MGRLLLVCRLAARDLRRRPAEAALLLLAIMAPRPRSPSGSSCTGSPQALPEHPGGDGRARRGRRVAPAPRRRGRRPRRSGGADRRSRRRRSRRSVSRSSRRRLEANGHTVAAQAEGRDTAPASIDQPKLTQGSWVDDGGVVIEAAFADALGVGAGDRITMSGAWSTPLRRCGRRRRRSSHHPEQPVVPGRRRCGHRCIAAVSGGVLPWRPLHPRRPGLAHPADTRASTHRRNPSPTS